MQFLAILKDSWREARDVRVLPMLLALSAALILVFASLSFTPQPAAELVSEGPVSSPLQLTLDNEPTEKGKRTPAFEEGLPLLFVLKAVEPLNGAPDSPRSPLRFLVLARYATADAGAQARAMPAATEEMIRRRFGRLGTMRLFVVTDVRPSAPNDPLLPAPPLSHEVYFEVKTQPTSETVRIWPHASSLGFGLMPLGPFWQFFTSASQIRATETPPLGDQVYIFADLLVNGLGSWVAVLVSVVVTAFFIPSMLHRGTLEPLLVKPIPRWRLLLYKYVGGLVFIFVNAAVAVVGVWLVLALRSGIWCHPLLLVVVILTFFFAILYAVSTLTSVLTHSPIVSILITCLAWALFFGVGRAYLAVHEPTGQPVELSPGLVRVLDTVHFVLPRTKDLDALTSRLLAQDMMPVVNLDNTPLWSSVNWGESLTVSGLFIAVMLGLACYRFGTKDF